MELGLGRIVNHFVKSTWSCIASRKWQKWTFNTINKSSETLCEIGLRNPLPPENLTSVPAKLLHAGIVNNPTLYSTPDDTMFGSNVHTEPTMIHEVIEDVIEFNPVQARKIIPARAITASSPPAPYQRRLIHYRTIAIIENRLLETNSKQGDVAPFKLPIPRIRTTLDLMNDKLGMLEPLL